MKLRLDITFIAILFFMFTLLSLFCCKNQDHSLIDSSILIEYEVEDSSDQYLIFNDSIRLLATHDGAMEIKDIKNKSTKKISINELNGSQIFSILKASDTTVYCLKSPLLSNQSHKNIVIEFDIFREKKLSLYSLSEKILVENNTCTVSTDSSVSMFPLLGCVFKNGKLYSIVTRYISTFDESFFKTKIPTVGFLSKDMKLNLLDGVIVPNPTLFPTMLGNNLTISGLVDGHRDYILVYFSHSDLIYIIDSRKNTVKTKSINILGIKPRKGEDAEEISKSFSNGVFEKIDCVQYLDIKYDSFRNEYWRFVRLPQDTMKAIQVNNPLYAFAILDTNFVIKNQGILPNFLSPIVSFTKENILFRSNKLLTEFKDKRNMRFVVSVSNDPSNSIMTINEHIELGKCDSCNGWSDYIRNYLKLSEDTVRLIVVPKYSCPSCIMGVFNKQSGINKMKEHGYKFLLLAPYDVFETVKNTDRIVNNVDVIHDESEYLKYLRPIYNPHLIMTVNRETIIEKYLNPDESEVLSEVILMTEKEID